MANFTKQMKQEIMEMLRIEELNFAIYLVIKHFKEAYAEELRSFSPVGNEREPLVWEGCGWCRTEVIGNIQKHIVLNWRVFFQGKAVFLIGESKNSVRGRT